MVKLKDEEIEQIKALDWIRHHHPELGKSAIHIANERSTSALYGFVLKRMGVRKGAPDLLWLKTMGKYHGLLIEVKTKVGKLSPWQKEFLEEANNDGYYADVAYGAQEVIDLFCEYFEFPKGRILV